MQPLEELRGELALFLKQNEISQKEFAQSAEFPESSLSRFLSGKRINLDNFYKLRAALNNMGGKTSQGVDDV